MDFSTLSPNELLAIFYVSSNVLCLLVFIYVFIMSQNSLTDHAAGKYFKYILNSHIIYFMLDAVWALFAFGIVKNDIAFLIVRILKHFIIAISSYLWFEYISIKMQSDLINSKRRKVYIYLILLLNLVLDIVLCISDKDVPIHKVGNSFYTNLISIGFMCATLLNGAYTIKKDKNHVKKTNISYCLYIVFFIVIGILQILFSDLPIMCYMTVFMVISMYSKRLRNLVSIDPLTKLNNRNSLEYYITNLKNEISDDIYVLMLDLDSFKQINDNYGHLEGDDVLITVAKVLRDNLYSYKESFLARYGGDEFIIVFKNIDEASLKNIIAKIKYDIEDIKRNYKISISCGYALMKKDESFEETLKKADNKLYEFKKS